MANSEVQTQMRAIGKTAKFFETTDNCPTCKQNISQEIKDSALSEAKIEAKSLQSRLTLIKDEYDGLVQDIDNWNHNLGSVREKTNDY